jgi:hypothetical protein
MTLIYYKREALNKKTIGLDSKQPPKDNIKGVSKKT